MKRPAGLKERLAASEQKNNTPFENSSIRTQGNKVETTIRMNMVGSGSER